MTPPTSGGRGTSGPRCAPSRTAVNYVNFLTEDADGERVRAAYEPALYARLARIKANYDPDNLFRANQTSGPRTAAERSSPRPREGPPALIERSGPRCGSPPTRQAFGLAITAAALRQWLTSPRAPPCSWSRASHWSACVVVRPSGRSSPVFPGMMPEFGKAVAVVHRLIPGFAGRP